MGRGNARGCLGVLWRSWVDSNRVFVTIPTPHDPSPAPHTAARPFPTKIFPYLTTLLFYRTILRLADLSRGNVKPAIKF